MSESAAQSLTLKFKAEPNTALVAGHAVAIDRSGYFLTAAHCVDYPVNYLIFSDGQTARIAALRVVAKI